MALTKVQVKAVLFILLIVGQDCIRIQKGSTVAFLRHQRSGGAVKPAEDQLREANQECSWKLLPGKLGCAGPGCSFRPLPLDASLSEMCRLTSEYMLNSSQRDTYVTLSAKLVEEKSDKFKKECAKAKFWQIKRKARCYRRLGHMLHSSELLMRAEKRKPEQDGADQQAEIDRAIKNMASMFGDDGAYILELREKMKSNVVGVAKNLEGSFKSMITNLKKLISGSNAEKEEARHDIRGMRAENETDASDDDEAEILKSAEQLMQKYEANMSDMDDGWHDIQELARDPESFESEVGSFLQVEGEATPQYFGPVMTAIIVVILILLIAMWVIYAFWFCAVGIHVFPYLIPIVLVLVVALAVMHILPNLSPSTTSRNPNWTRKTTTGIPWTRGNGGGARNTEPRRNGAGRDSGRNGRIGGGRDSGRIGGGRDSGRNGRPRGGRNPRSD